jgi:hypothetical protein
MHFLHLSNVIDARPLTDLDATVLPALVKSTHYAILSSRLGGGDLLSLLHLSKRVEIEDMEDRYQILMITRNSWKTNRLLSFQYNFSI